MMSRNLRALTVALALLPLSLSPVFAGRERISQGDYNAYDRSDVEVEIEFGREIAARLAGTFKTIEDKALLQYLNQVGVGIAAQGPRTDITYRFGILDTDIPNAFAAPGGYIFITRGALKAMNSEAELAAALAHEIGHVANRDIVRELKIGGKGDLTAAGLSQVISGGGGSTAKIIQEMMHASMEILLKRGYKVEDEFNADHDSIMLLAATGYEITSLAGYLDKVTKMETDPSPSSTVRTHPALEERTARINKTIEEIGMKGVSGELRPERFLEHVKSLK